jgi:hypothetical protein
MNRTLIVGVGSTGRDICDDILRRIAWSSKENTLDKVPWVETLVLETEKKDGIPSKQFGKYVDLIPNEEELRKLRTGASDYKEALDLEVWIDSPVLAKLPYFAQGAGGIRMAGRLVFFSPTVFTRVKTKIIEAFQRLSGVDVATLRRAVADLPADLTLEDRIQVLMVGSLGGGTASGCFLDLAYLIRRIAVEDLGGKPINLDGYFTLPPLATTDSILRANTFAGLQEWNHYLSTGTTFRARFADGNGRDYIDPGAPFERSVLMQVPDGVSYTEFKRRVGDYLYSLSTSLDFGAIAGKVVDSSVFMAGVDKVGATRRWATIGMRAIEFPADRLVLGCNYKLIEDTLNRQLDPSDEADTGPTLADARLDAGSLRRLLETDTLLSQIGGQVAQFSEISAAHEGQVLKLADEPGSSVVFGGLLGGHIVTKLGGKAVETRRSLAARLCDDPKIIGADVSLRTLSARLTRLENAIRDELNGLERVNQAGKTRATLDREKAQADLNAAMAFVPAPHKRSMFFFQTPPPIDMAPVHQDRKNKLLLLISGVVEEYFQNTARPEIYREARTLISLWQARITRMIGYLEKALEYTDQQMSDIRQDMEAFRSDYLAPPDIDEEYRAMREREASNVSTEREVERGWQREVVGKIDLIPKELLLGRSDSRYDQDSDPETTKVKAEELVKECAKTAQSRFSSRLHRTILDRLNDPEAALRWLSEVEEMLNFNRNEVQTQRTPEAKQSIGFLFCDRGAISRSSSSQRAIFERGLEDVKARNPNLYEIHLLNPNRISMIKDFSAFSINALAGFGRDGQFRRAYEEMNNRPGELRESRKDVAWTPIDASSMRIYQKCRNLFLVGLAAEMIALKRGGQFVFSYRKVQKEEMHFRSAQWADNASRLYQEQAAYHQLIRLIEDWYRDVGALAVVEAMRSYASDTLPVTGLNDGDAPLQRSTFLESVYQFWREYDDVAQEFKRLDPDVDPAQRFYFTKQQAVTKTIDAPRDGYYCTNCGQFLGEDNTDLVLETPCSKCQDPLLTGSSRKDGRGIA